MKSVFATLFVLYTAVLSAQTLELQAIQSNPACAGFSDGAINTTPIGGQAPYTFVWSTGSTDASVSNLSAGTYTLTVTDQAGSTVVVPFTLTNPPALVASVASVTNICTGGNTGSAVLGVTGGSEPYQVTWSNGQTGLNLIGLPAGVYMAMVIDNNGCMASAEVTITSGTGLEVGISTVKAECVGLPTGQATAFVSSPGSGQYTYQWSNGGPNQATLTGLAANTTLTVTVTDTQSGCTGTATALVEAHGQISVLVTDTDVDCVPNNNGTATAQPINGVGPYTYAWNINGAIVTDASVSGLGVGVYAVTVTDAGGCTAASVADISAVTLINPQFSLQVLDCEGGFATIRIVNTTTGTFDWSWTVGTATGTLAFNTANPPVFNIPYNAPLSVTATATNAAGCSGSANQQLNVGAPPVVSASISGGALNCVAMPTTITVTGQPDYTYTWTPSVTVVTNFPQVVTVNPTTPTLYTVVANDGGCLDTLSINVNPMVPVDVSILGGTAITTCDPATPVVSTLNVPVTGVQIQWFNAAGQVIGNQPNLTVTHPVGVSTYTVVVSDAQGCTDSATATVTNNAVDVNASFLTATTACVGEPLTAQVVNTDLTDVLTYAWAASSTAVSFSSTTVANPTITISAAGTYTVTVTATNQHGCTKTLTAIITAAEGGAPVNFTSNAVCGGLTVAFDNPTAVAGTWNFGDGSPTSNAVDPTHTYTQAGAYTVTFTPNNACFSPSILNINVTAASAVNAAITAPANFPCLLQANVAFTDASQSTSPIVSWAWTFQPGGQTSNQQNPNITFAQSGTVIANLTVTDANGCIDTAQAVSLPVSIVNDTIPAPNLVCLGNSIAINPLANSNYSYIWTATPPDPTLQPNVPSPVVTPLVPTTYAVVITNGNCSVAQAIVVTPNTAAAVSAGPDQTLCVPEAVTLVASAAPGSSYTWATDPQFANVVATTASTQFTPVAGTNMRYVRVAAPNGCLGLDSVQVALAPIQIAANPAEQTICNASEATLQINNLNPTDVLTYAWSNNLPQSGTQTVTVSQNSTFTAIVQNQAGCADTLDFTVNVSNITASINQPDTICAGQSTTLQAIVTGGSNYVFSWSPAGSLNNAATQNPTANPDTDTDYTLVVTDGLGCTAEAVTTLIVMATACEEPYLFVPNAFTPNNDDNNDFFRVRGINMTEIYFAVWDRWGEKMYETNEIDHKGWDGTFRDVQSTPDAYAWYARIRCGNGQVWEKRGNVTLLR
jgi:gliding motility-associated-like protein